MGLEDLRGYKTSKTLEQIHEVDLETLLGLQSWFQMNWNQDSP